MLALLAITVAPTFTLALCGDLMLNDIPPKTDPFAQIHRQFSQADLVLANLESPITDVGRPTQNKLDKDLRHHDQFILRADPAHAKQIAQAGIAMVSLGNNHAMDHRRAGLDRMIALLNANRIAHAGAGDDLEQAQNVAVVTLPSGERIGMISALTFVGAKALQECTPATATKAGVMTLDFHGKPDQAAIKDWVDQAKQHCDFLVVALHGGLERHPLPTAYQVALARAFVDAGADLIWGNHPHVLEGAEIYKGVPILYSCGNLVANSGGQTDVFDLTFQGNKLIETTVVPCRIAAGQVRPEPGPYAKTAAKYYLAQRGAQSRNSRANGSFARLCALLLKHFPNKNSDPLVR